MKTISWATRDLGELNYLLMVQKKKKKWPIWMLLPAIKAQDINALESPCVVHIMWHFSDFPKCLATRPLRTIKMFH